MNKATISVLALWLVSNTSWAATPNDFAQCDKLKQKDVRQACLDSLTTPVIKSSSLPAPSSPSATSAYNKFVGKITDYVRSDLKDPGSAQFENIIVRVPKSLQDDPLDTTITIVCGAVNAKNSYGGYTGSSRFIAQKLGGIPAPMMEYEKATSGDRAMQKVMADSFLKSWDENCVSSAKYATVNP